VRDDGKGPTNFDRIEKIELADRPRRKESDGPPLPELYRPITTGPRRRIWPWVVILLLLGAVAALRLQRVRDQLPGLDSLSPPRAPKPMIVTSNPSGATLKIDGAEVGKTPWAGDNHWHGRGVPYELSAPGYQTLKGFFEGDKEFNLDLELRHK
jgi:serine/threonine-protein kinase